jgi:tRNA (guanine37-N1)-methyltransferase
MPYPELALEYLPYALKALRDGRGWIHIYLHIYTSKNEHWRTRAQSVVEDRLRELGARHRVVNIRKIRNVSPRTHQVVVDVYY